MPIASEWWNRSKHRYFFSKGFCIQHSTQHVYICQADLRRWSLYTGDSPPLRYWCLCQFSCGLWCSFLLTDHGTNFNLVSLRHVLSLRLWLGHTENRPTMCGPWTWPFTAWLPLWLSSPFSNSSLASMLDTVWHCGPCLASLVFGSAHSLQGFCQIASPQCSQDSLNTILWISLSYSFTASPIFKWRGNVIRLFPQTFWLRENA